MNKSFIYRQDQNYSDIDTSEYEEMTIEEYCSTLSSDEEAQFYAENGIAINCHVLISKETLKWAYELVDNWESYDSTPLDRAFTGYNEFLNAIVFLQLKQCKRGKNYTPVTQHEYNLLIKKCLDKGIPFGSDSCGCHAVAHSFKDLGKKVPETLLQPCESTCESFYCSVDGVYFPCSFNEFEKYGISYTEVKDFITDVWYADKTKLFRDKLLSNKRQCPTYKIIG